MNIVVGMGNIGGCEYIRALVPYEQLKRNGYPVTYFTSVNPAGAAIGPSNVPNQLIGTNEWDVMVLQRELAGDVLGVARAMQEQGRKIVYELDDNFHTMPSTNPFAKKITSGTTMSKMCDEYVRMCDLLVVSTQGLYDEYARMRPGKPTVICHNALDDRQFFRFKPAMTGAPKREGEIRIGWSGSNTHASDLAMIVPALCKVMDERPQVRLVFVGADMRGLFPAKYLKTGVRIGSLDSNVQRFGTAGIATRQEQAVLVKGGTNRVDFAGQTFVEPGGFRLRHITSDTIGPVAYYDLVDKSDFDIAVAPIESQTFNRSKSWIKVLEYGMLGIPTIASRFGPYRDFHNGGGQIVTAEGAADWYKALMIFVDDQNVRATFAQHNRAVIQQKHLISRGISQWEAALEKIGVSPFVAL